MADGGPTADAGAAAEAGARPDAGAPPGDTWFKANLDEVQGFEHPQAGVAYLFGETRPFGRYEDLGINIRVLEPGQPASLYHDEPAEEFFIVLGGECLAIVEDQEVPLRTWDFLHTPPRVPHVVIGAGDGPATVLMVGGRRADGPPHYPVSELAASYGASVKTETNSGREAWQQAGWELRMQPTSLPWPPR
ncbi:MAG: cupin domain-containing protein [Actinobacteria bacterium]|nr:cupin domain-containing protein [Actinomycetota bacterium]